jgi:hypothetical protein
VTDGESKPSPPPAPIHPSSARWPWYVALVLIVEEVAPLVAAVRKATEPHVGTWPAHALGLLAAAAAAAPLFALVSWILRRELSGQAGGLAGMIYRPATVPALAFLGAVFQDFPSALTEWATWGFVAALLVLLTGAVLIQRRRGRAWTWWVAVPVGIVIALAAWLVAALVSHLAPGMGQSG